MCGRYVRKNSEEVIFSFFEINDIRIPWKPNYNVAPTTQIPVIRSEDDGMRELIEMRWGLIPFWSKPDAKLPMMINARAETVSSKPSYRSAFKSRRCLVPASGYYEWKKLAGGTKQPFYFQRSDGHSIAFAGIWDGATVATITTTPNEEAAPVHDRMPVILEKENFARFLNPEPLSEEEQKRLLAPSPNGTLVTWPVDRAVGNVRNNDRALIDPLPKQEDELRS